MASKSLGTLTLDLVAKVGGFTQGMDKAERSSAKWRKQVEKDAKTIGTALGAGSAAALAGKRSAISRQAPKARMNSATGRNSSS